MSMHNDISFIIDFRLCLYEHQSTFSPNLSLRLSDAFAVKEDAYSLELLATLLNINPGHYEELLSACKPLGDYAQYTAKVRTYVKDMPLNEAVERAIEECIRDDVLAEFLRTNKAEAMSVSIYEYDEEKTMRQLKEEYLEEGLQTGIHAFIEGFEEEGFSGEQIIEKLISKFSLTREQAETYYKNYTFS